MIDIKIDPEFKELNRPLSDEEYNGLKEKIKTEGFRGAIDVWFGENVLLDGHHRKRICDELGIEYNIETIEIPDRHAAINWIVDNQLSKRNLDPAEKRYLIGKKYNEEKMERGGDRKSNRQSDGMKGETAERIAKEQNVSPRTVERAGDFAKKVDQLPPKEKEQVLSGKKKLKKTEKVEKGENIKTQEKNVEYKSLGVGVRYAVDAINCLKKIPSDDKLKKDGYEMVINYINNDS